ncbi:hypothetical protein (plasmid) [Citrobacter freundii]|uniref:Uncharacterized protein n=8 Tax=Enterobacteriaceae TaxID=543 RepID=A0A7M1HY00_ECOLX|nr:MULTISPECIES: hypothetical protein [Enterobacteriaceae]AKJ19305.1 hypothetical protein [Enterobacter cloacae]API82325.1 Hypothetical protein [Leclercia adecarboxylata]ASR81846.1 Hypothetical protein [Cronobacter sakazakii]AUF80544.1 Hypothetical protein [Raoultella ornithinolytica]QKY82168.1 hypothetical protein [Escherichia coli]QVQ59505.1 hypothetical protein [Enterobacter cloacae complex sp.]QZX58772.1 hypothetical protein [Klebsiella michiganensis]UHA81212.1 hypothetical protein [Ent
MMHHRQPALIMVMYHWVTRQTSNASNIKLFFKKRQERSLTF